MAPPLVSEDIPWAKSHQTEHRLGPMIDCKELTTISRASLARECIAVQVILDSSALTN